MLGTLFYAYYSVEFNGNFSDEVRFNQYWELTKKLTNTCAKINLSELIKEF